MALIVVLSPSITEKKLVIFICLPGANEPWKEREHSAMTITMWCFFVTCGNHGMTTFFTFLFPRWDDLRFSNTTGILPKCGLLVLKLSKRRVHPLLKKILDPPCNIWAVSLFLVIYHYKSERSVSALKIENFRWVKYSPLFWVLMWLP